MTNFIIDRIRFRWKGNWQPSFDYRKDDIVFVDGKTFVCLSGHTSDDDFWLDNNSGQINKTFTVTVGTDSETSNPNGKFYFDNAENPVLDLIKGGTYVFDQSDNSNTEFKSNTNILLLGVDADGGNPFDIGVTYFLDNTPVTKENYISGFEDATLRKLELNYPSNIELDKIFYYSNNNFNFSNKINVKYSSYWELMFDGYAWRGEWQPQTTYLKNNIVVFKSTQYICVEDHESSNDSSLTIDINKWEINTEFSNWNTDWEIDTDYGVGDVVRYGGYLYICNTNHTSTNAVNSGLANDQEKWTTLLQGVTYTGNWQPSVLYKKGEVVKYDASLWKATSDHVSTSLSGELRTDQSNWEIYLPAFKYEGTQWSSNTNYEKGDIVTYGGYNYIALVNNINSNPSTDTNSWELLTKTYNYQGEWLSNDNYKTGDVVLNGGYMYIAIADSSGVYPDSNANFWTLLAVGQRNLGLWNSTTEYLLGDYVTFKGISYICKLRHTNEDPSEDVGNVFWDTLIGSVSTNVLEETGDIVTYGSSNEKLSIGSTGQLLTAGSGGKPVWETTDQEVRKIYVSASTGNDSSLNPENKSTPYKTIKEACLYAASVTTPPETAAIIVETGLYKEELPISVPRNVSIIGNELRTSVVTPAEGFKQLNMFLLNNGSILRNMTLKGLEGTLGAPNSDGTRRPSAGAYASLDPGNGPNDESVWITTRSPYVQNVTTFGTGCVGVKIDGSLHNGGNKSIVANDFTQIISDGIGAWCTNLGRTELVSVFTYYAHIGYLSENGGKIRATNGNNSYGDFGAVSEGVSLIEDPITANVDNTRNEAQVSVVHNNGDEILAVGYSNAGKDYTTASIDFFGSGGLADTNMSEFRNGGISSIVPAVPDDSGFSGGFGYTDNVANAQDGDATTITLSPADLSGTNELYSGQMIFILSGVGAGQYAVIDTYNSFTKVATVKRATDNRPGWEHIYPGYPIKSSLNITTRYKIEPRVEINDPEFTATEFTFPLVRSWADGAEGNGRIVVINNSTSPEGNVRIYSDDNGVNWSSALSVGDDKIKKIVYNGTKFFILAASTSGNLATNNIYISDDGDIFTETTLPSSQLWDDIIVTENNDVVLAGGNDVYISTDNGNSWTSINVTGTVSQSWELLSYGNGRLIAISPADGDVAYSDDNGTNWTITSAALASGESWSSVAYGNSRFVALATSGTVSSYSFDSITWYQNTIDAVNISDSLTEINYAQGIFVSVGDQNTFAKSQDGMIWTNYDNEDSTQYTLTQTEDWGNPIFSSSDDSWIIPQKGTGVYNKVFTGARAFARVNVVASRISEFIIYEPGSGYGSEPFIRVSDNKKTVDVEYTVDINSGVLAQPTFNNRGSKFVQSSATISGDGHAEIDQFGDKLKIKNVTRLPRPGNSISITSIEDINFQLVSIVNVSGTEPNLELTIQVFPEIDQANIPDDNESLTIKQNFSQVRLTNHDFLDIGTGNKEETQYPQIYIDSNIARNLRKPENEVVESSGGRVFYTSTDQDGNFRAGELFEVEQSTGIITISASQFDISGLTEVTLGGIRVGGSTVSIQEFSTDDKFLADSNNVVPTQKAIASYLQSRIAGGGSSVTTSKLTAGFVSLGTNVISTTTGDLNFNSNVTANKGHTGYLLALQYFKQKR